MTALLAAVPDRIPAADLTRLLPADSRPVTVTVQVTLDGADAFASAARFAEHLRILAASGAAEGTRIAAVSTTLVVGEPAEERPPAAGAPPREARPVRLFPARRDLYVDDRLVGTTRLEFDLLLALASQPGRVFTRSQLLRTVWGHTVVCGQRTVDVHVRRVRAKLGEHRDAIETVRGVGYRLDDNALIAVVHESL
ncbi:MAG: winged helix-turn-helix domain-containing protein [Mycobacteriales bacterium]